MSTLHNHILINAPVEQVWNILSDLETLDKYDPVVKKATALSGLKGLGAIRKCDCSDNKNWFEEKITEWKPNEALTFEITSCSIPMKSLSHRYTLQRIGNQTKVTQEMNYKLKFGVLGSLLDMLMIRKSTDSSIKKFFAGLKNHTEKNTTNYGIQ